MKIGVLGVGNMGRNHIRVLKRLSYVCELVGFYDPDKVRAAHAQEEFAVPYFDDLTRLLHSVDAVCIVTPASTHKDIAILCANEHVHMFIEKPLAPGEQDARELVEYLSSRQLVVQVGHIERFNPVIQELRRVIESDRPISVDIVRAGPFDERIEIDVVHDLMLHDIDILSYLFNQPFMVSGAVGRAIHRGSLDLVQAVGLGGNGEVLRLLSSRISQVKTRRIEVVTELAEYRGDLVKGTLEIIRKGAAAFRGDSSLAVSSHTETVLVSAVEPLAEELKAFIEAISENRDACVGLSDGLNAVAIADIISAMCGSPNLVTEERL